MPDIEVLNKLNKCLRIKYNIRLTNSSPYTCLKKLITIKQNEEEKLQYWCIMQFKIIIFVYFIYTDTDASICSEDVKNQWLSGGCMVYSVYTLSYPTAELDSLL